MLVCHANVDTTRSQLSNRVGSILVFQLGGAVYRNGESESIKNARPLYIPHWESYTDWRRKLAIRDRNADDETIFIFVYHYGKCYLSAIKLLLYF